MEHSKLVELVGENWADFLKPFMCPDENGKCRYDSIAEKLKAEYGDKDKKIYPSKGQVFRPFKETPLENLRVILLGVEPYHKMGYANGLAYATDKHDPLPEPLIALYKGLEKDAGNGLDLHINSRNGELKSPGGRTWMEQGVLLLNMSLTVEAGKANSHWPIWEPFTNFVINNLWRLKRDLVYIGWGDQAKEVLRYRGVGTDAFGKDGHGTSEGVNVFQAFVLTSDHPTQAVKDKREWVTDNFSKTNLIFRINNLGPAIEW